MASDWVYACSAAARSPRACARSPTRRCATASSSLPAGVGGIERGQPLEDGQVLGVRLLCRRQVAASLRQVPDPAVRDRQLLLPAGVGGIERGQPLEDGQVLGECLFCRRQVAASLRQVPDPAYANASPCCQPGVGGIERGQPLGDGQ